MLPRNSSVYSSQLSRTIKTFKAAEKSGFIYSSYTVDNNFAEQDLGDYAGLKYEDLDKKTKQLGVYHPNWLCALDHTPPKGESYNNLYERVTTGINKIIQNKKINSTNKGNDVVIFSHGGPIRAAISFALDGSQELAMTFWIDNISISRFDYIDGSWQIKFVNCLPYNAE